MVTAVIVDDEKPGRQNLRTLLAKYCPQVNVLAFAENPRKAKQVINDTQPQLVFLDIEMPLGTGFDLLAEYDKIPFEVIFVTAFEKYALRAFRLSACDYLMKPIDISELVTAVTRAAEHIAAREENLRLKTLIDNMKLPEQKHRVALPTVTGLVFAAIADIIRLEAEGSYTWFHFANRPKILVTKHLGIYEEALNPGNFIRVHRHQLINGNHITEFKRANSPIVIMSDGSAVTVSQRKREAVMQYIDKL